MPMKSSTFKNYQITPLTDCFVFFQDHTRPKFQQKVRRNLDSSSTHTNSRLLTKQINLYLVHIFMFAVIESLCCILSTLFEISAMSTIVKYFNWSLVRLVGCLMSNAFQIVIVGAQGLRVKHRINLTFRNWDFSSSEKPDLHIFQIYTTYNQQGE